MRKWLSIVAVTLALAPLAVRAQTAGQTLQATDATHAAGIASTGTGNYVLQTAPTIITPTVTAPVTATGLASGTVVSGSFLGLDVSNHIVLSATPGGGFTGGTLTTPLITVLSGTGAAGLNLPQGVAPTTPNNGDVWTTSAGMYVRIAGSTVGPLSSGGSFTGGTLTTPLITVLSGTGAAGFNLPPGVAPTTPNNGDVWTTSAGVYARIAGATVGPLLASNGVATSLTGTAAGLTAGTVTTNANLTGDVTSVGNATTLATVNGTPGAYTCANVTANAKGLITTMANGSCGGTGANPSATAGPAAVNGSATTFMRSDGAPPVQKASNAQFGIVEADGTTLTCTAGVCSVGVVPVTSVSGTDRSSAIDPTIVASDMGNQINLTNSGGLTVVLPAKATGLWQVGQTLLLVSQGAGAVTLTNSTTLTPAGSCSSIAAGNALLITANSDASHLDCQPFVGATGAGTVTSVAMTVPTGFAIGGSPVTTTGTLALTASTETANTVWAGPTSGSAATPGFRALVAADVPATTLPVPGSGATLVGPRSYYVCTTTCSVALPTPAAGYEFCVRNDDNVSTVITFAAIASVQFENTNYTSYKTANTSIVSGGAAGDKMCVLGRDNTHYLVMSFNGTWS